MPAPILFKCAKCDFSGSSMTTWGQFNYKANKIRVPVNRVIGLCYSCDSVAPVEKLPAEDYLQRLKDNDAWDKLIEDEEKRLQLLANRSSEARCLSCGSHEFDIIPTPFIDTDQYHSEEDCNTGLTHRNCGGEILGKKSSANFFMGDKLPTKIYTIEGVPLEN